MNEEDMKALKQAIGFLQGERTSIESAITESSYQIQALERLQLEHPIARRRQILESLLTYQAQAQQRLPEVKKQLHEYEKRLEALEKSERS